MSVGNSKNEIRNSSVAGEFARRSGSKLPGYTENIETDPLPKFESVLVLVLVLGLPSDFWFWISDLNNLVFSLPTDLFDFFRLAVAWIVSIYATIITAQSLWGWYVFLTGSDKYITLVRRYVIVHGLRLRFRAFWGDVVITLLLAWACILLWVAHGRVERLRVALDQLRQTPPTVMRVTR